MARYIQCYEHDEEIYRDGNNLVHIRTFGEFEDVVGCKDRLFICESNPHPFTRAGVLSRLNIATRQEHDELKRIKSERTPK